MSSPWLHVPLEDYEGHMSAPSVGQLAVLAEIFRDALAQARPESVAILGIAGGNGLEHIDLAVTRRVVGLDVNTAYLDATRRRHGHMSGLELHCADFKEERLTLDPVEFVHAALIFEHAGADRCLENAVAMVAPGGVLSVVLQLPSQIEEGVSPTKFASMQTLRGGFAMIAPERLCDAAAGRGFGLKRWRRVPLPGGKAFWVGLFSR